jgi:hypothetical protein
MDYTPQNQKDKRQMMETIFDWRNCKLVRILDSSTVYALLSLKIKPRHFEAIFEYLTEKWGHAKFLFVIETSKDTKKINKVLLKNNILGQFRFARIWR